MARSPILIVVCALALVACSSARAQDATPSSPSLGDLARQAQKDKDKNRDKDKDSPTKPAAKVFTNDDMSSGSSGDSAVPGGSLGQGAQLSAESKPGAAPSAA